MIGLLVSFVLGAVSGSIATYFFLRNNPVKAAVINSAVSQADKVVSSVAASVK